MAGEVDLLDTVPVAVNPAVDDRVQLSPRREGPEAVGHEELFANGMPAHVPGGERGGRFEEEVGKVEGTHLGEPLIGRLLAIGEDRKSTRLNSSHLGISYAV